MRQKISRLHALTGLGSLIAVAGCAGSPGTRSLLPVAARGSGPAPASARFDPAQFFRVVKSKVAPLNLPRRAKGATRSTSSTSYDAASATSVVSDGAGNSVWYDAQGSPLMTIAMSVLSDGSGMSLTMTAMDGTQRSSAIPLASAFDGNGTSTVGALTMSSNQSTGQYVGNYQTDSGVVTILSAQSALGDFTTTMPDGSTFAVSQATVMSSGLIPSAHGRHPQDLSDPRCIIAIAALVAAIIGLCVLFWYAIPIVASIAAQVSAAAGVTGTVQVIGGSGIYGAICAAVLATCAGLISAINSLCASAGPITLTPAAVTLAPGGQSAVTITQANYYAQTFTCTQLNGPANGAPSVSLSGNIASVTAGNTAGTWQYAIGDASGTSTTRAVLTVTVLPPSPSPSPSPSPTQTPPPSPPPSSTPPPSTPPPSSSPMPSPQSSTPPPSSSPMPSPPSPSLPPSSSPLPSPPSPSLPPSSSPLPSPQSSIPPPSSSPMPSYSPSFMPSPSSSPLPSYSPRP